MGKKRLESTVPAAVDSGSDAVSLERSARAAWEDAVARLRDGRCTSPRTLLGLALVLDLSPHDAAAGLRGGPNCRDLVNGLVGLDDAEAEPAYAELKAAMGEFRALDRRVAETLRLIERDTYKPVWSQALLLASARQSRRERAAAGE